MQKQLHEKTSDNKDESFNYTSSIDLIEPTSDAAQKNTFNQSGKMQSDFHSKDGLF